MAAYAATVTTDTPKRVRTGGPLAQISGICNITNYNSTLAEITDITKHFKTILSVVGISSENGYIALWNRTSKAFEVYNPVTAHTHTGPSHTHSIPAGTDAGGGTSGAEGTGATGAATAAVGSEVANDTDCGEFTFIAIGTT